LGRGVRRDERSFDVSKSKDATLLTHTGSSAAPLRARTVSPPLQRGSTLLLPSAAALYDDEKHPTYGMNSLAIHEALVDGLRGLEHADHVELFTSGLAAVTGAILAVDSVYGPTRRFCDKVLKRFGVSVRYFPADAAPDAVLGMAGPTTRLIFLESPGSLTFEMQDIPAIAALARARGILTAVDNTWGSGLLFRPVEHGVSLSIQALTKYVCGHSDVFMGSVATSDPAVAEALTAFVRDTGASVSPDDAFQALRGLRTLELRLKRHGESGLQVARWLAEQPQVARVMHPALPGDPGHALWRRDFTGAAGLFGAVLKPAPKAEVHALFDRLTLFGLGFSWGGYESLAIPCDPQIKRTASPWREKGPLIRLNIGLEDPADLIEDLRQALAAYPV
jgi:cystathionine beta-lyase